MLTVGSVMKYRPAKEMINKWECQSHMTDVDTYYVKCSHKGHSCEKWANWYQ